MWLSLYRLRLSLRWMSCILQKIIHQISFPLTRILLPLVNGWLSLVPLVGVTILLITSIFQHSHNSFIYNQTFLISTKPFLGQTCALISNVHPKIFILNFWPKKYFFYYEQFYEIRNILSSKVSFISLTIPSIGNKNNHMQAQVIIRVHPFVLFSIPPHIIIGNINKFLCIHVNICKPKINMHGKHYKKINIT